MLVQFLNKARNRIVSALSFYRDWDPAEELFVTDDKEWAELWKEKDRRFALVHNVGSKTWRCHIIDYDANTAAAMCGIIPNIGWATIKDKEDGVYEDVCSTCATHMNTATARAK